MRLQAASTVGGIPAAVILPARTTLDPVQVRRVPPFHHPCRFTFHQRDDWVVPQTSDPRTPPTLYTMRRHCWRSRPTRPVTHPKTAQGACELWVRSDLPGAIPCEQTATIDFANSVCAFCKEFSMALPTAAEPN